MQEHLQKLCSILLLEYWKFSVGDNFRKSIIFVNFLYMVEVYAVVQVMLKI